MQNVFSHLLTPTAEALARAYELDNYGQPYMEGLLANQYLQSIYRSLESFSRASRAEVRKYDEVMETFRRHVYSLRRLILSGTAEQNNDVLRRYFQVSSFCMQLHDTCYLVGIAACMLCATSCATRLHYGPCLKRSEHSAAARPAGALSSLGSVHLL